MDSFSLIKEIQFAGCSVNVIYLNSVLSEAKTVKHISRKTYENITIKVFLWGQIAKCVQYLSVTWDRLQLHLLRKNLLQTMDGWNDGTRR